MSVLLPLSSSYVWWLGATPRSISVHSACCHQTGLWLPIRADFGQQAWHLAGLVKLFSPAMALRDPLALLARRFGRLDLHLPARRLDYPKRPRFL